MSLQQEYDTIFPCLFILMTQNKAVGNVCWFLNENIQYFSYKQNSRKNITPTYSAKCYAYLLNVIAFEIRTHCNIL